MSWLLFQGEWGGMLKGKSASVDQVLLLGPESFLLLLVSQITFFFASGGSCLPLTNGTAPDPSAWGIASVQKC